MGKLGFSSIQVYSEGIQHRFSVLVGLCSQAHHPVSSENFHNFERVSYNALVALDRIYVYTVNHILVCSNFTGTGNILHGCMVPL